MGMADTMALASGGVTVFDPHSTLVSGTVLFGEGVVLWPGVILDIRGGGSLSIGAGTVLFPGTRIVADDGRITIGAETEIGEEGGFTIKADGKDVEITIGDRARLLGCGSLSLNNTIGDGAQVLGPIRMQRCMLGSGGCYRSADPDRRGGVLKGSGVARGLDVPRGHVIQAFGLFAGAPLRPQSFFHPPGGG